MDPFSKGHPLEGLMSRVNALIPQRYEFWLKKGTSACLSLLGSYEITNKTGSSYGAEITGAAGWI
jgi:hypothetical protein